jgi:hypothetical protein
MSMEQYVTVTGRYFRGFSWASSHWDDICAEHCEEFPRIAACYPGTLNLILPDDAGYVPPGEALYRKMAKKRGKGVNTYEDGNYLSPLAKVVELNGVAVEAWIYRGGHPENVLEMLALYPLVMRLALRPGDRVTARIVEFSVEGSAGMPSAPPSQPGRSALSGAASIRPVLAGG